MTPPACATINGALVKMDAYSLANYSRHGQCGSMYINGGYVDGPDISISE